MNLPQILQDSRVVPYTDPKTKKFVGFKFEAVRKGSFQEKLGARVGDILVEVNGEPVTTAEKAMEIYAVMAHVKKVQVMFLRGKSLINLIYILE